MTDLYNGFGPTTIKGPNKDNVFYGPESGDEPGGYVDLGRTDNDSLTGGSRFDDFIMTPGRDTLVGGDFYDVLEVYSGAVFLGADPVVAAASKLRVDLAAGTYEVDWLDRDKELVVASSGRLREIEAVLATRGNDTILGSDGGYVFPDGTVLGEVYILGPGDDVLNGRGGRDMLSFLEESTGLFGKSSGRIVIDGAAGTATGKRDVDRFENIEAFTLTPFNDIFTGGESDEDVLRSGGTDRLDGGGGRDTLDYREPFFGGPSGGGIVADLAVGRVVKGDGEVDLVKEFENVIGSSADDEILGDGKDNELSGMEGDDTLDGGEGEDVLSYADEVGRDGARVDLEAGTATDTFGDEDEVNGFENVLGSSQEDRIAGDDFANALSGLAGTDNLKGRGAADTIEGGDDKDLIFGDDGDDDLNGEDGDDLVFGGTGADLVAGGEGDDTLGGLAGGDTVKGHEDDDVLKDETMDVDQIKMVTNWTDAAVSGAPTDAPEGANVLDGGAGADTLTGRGFMFGGSEGDALSGEGVLRGDAGDDTLSGSSKDSGPDSDIGIAVLIGGAGNDVLDGELNTTAYYGYLERGVFVDLEQGVARAGADDRDTLSNIDRVIGTNFGDVLKSSTSAGALYGLDGDDTISATGQGDTGFVLAGAGDDEIKSSGVYDISAAEGDDTIDSVGSEVTVDGGADADVISVRGSEGRQSGQGHRIDGRDGNDTISFSGYGSVEITMGDGDDVVTLSSKPSSFDSSIRMGDGEDTIRVRQGKNDVDVEDFRLGEDLIDISALTDKDSDTFKEIKFLAERSGMEVGLA